MEDARRDVEPLLGDLHLRPRPLEDQVAVPRREVRQDQVAVVGSAERGMKPEERLGMGALVDFQRVVVGLVLLVGANERGVLLAWVEVKRDPLGEVEDLREAIEALVGLRVFDAHERRRVHRDRVLQRDPNTAFERDVGEPLVRRPDPIVGLGHRPEPALADEAPLADGQLRLGQAKATARRQPLAGDPRRLETDDATPV